MDKSPSADDLYDIDDFEGSLVSLVFLFFLIVALICMMRKCENIISEDVPVAVARAYPQMIQCPHCEELVPLTQDVFLLSDSDSDDENYV